MFEEIYPNPIQVEQSIYTIGNSVESDEIIIKYYQWLIDNIQSLLAPAQYDQITNLIEIILKERINHNNILKNMYFQLTGNVVNIVEKEFAEPEDFKIEIMAEYIRTLEDIQKYGLIMSGLPSLYYRDLIYSIISDKIRHASLYNYILNIITNIK